MATSSQPHPAAGISAAEAAAAAVEAVKVYGAGETRVRALDEVSVGFRRGEFAAIMGPSGSGKSTLLHCLAGLDETTDGSIWLGGVELTGMSDRELTLLRRERIGFIFQSFNLVPTLTAEENVLLPVSLAGAREDRGWFDTIVDTLGLRDRLTHRPTELSGGQQQRVAAARALVTRPDVVYADEPTGNLDSSSGAALLRFLRQAVDELGQTIVMVTHDAIAASYADRVLFLKDGRIVHELEAPTVDDVLECMKRLGEEAHASGDA